MEFKSWPNSTQINYTTYDPISETLIIAYKTSNSRYSYDKVPVSIWNDLLRGDSIGKFVSTQIKGKYEFRKL